MPGSESSQSLRSSSSSHVSSTVIKPPDSLSSYSTVVSELSLSTVTLSSVKDNSAPLFASGVPPPRSSSRGCSMRHYGIGPRMSPCGRSSPASRLFFRWPMNLKARRCASTLTARAISPSPRGSIPPSITSARLNQNLHIVPERTYTIMIRSACHPEPKAKDLAQA